MSSDQMKSMSDMLYRSEELSPELSQYLISVGNGMKVLRHPLVSTMFYVPELNALHNEQLAKKKEAIVEAKAERNWNAFVHLHERPYRFNAFCEIEKLLTDHEYWRMLGAIWSDSENLWQFTFLISRLLNSDRKGRGLFMNTQERRFLASLPDKLAVYRGHIGKNKAGWSWSLSYLKAYWFSGRFSHKNTGVARAVVNKSDVIAVITRRNEFEIIVDPKIAKGKKFDPIEWGHPLYVVLGIDGAKGLPVLHHGSYHGLSHWRKVDWNAMQICKALPAADVEVCRAFAYLHDCRRQNEETDSMHGENGAAYAQDLHENGKLPLIAGQMKLLTDAIRDHEKGQTTDDPTIGACWDADRLDIMRVGTAIDPKYLSTQAGKDLVWQA